MAPPADLSLTPRSEIPAPRASDIPLTIAGNAAPALRDEDVLRWRAFIHRSSSGTREPVQEIAVRAASDEVLDPVSGSPRRGLSEVDFAAATASLRGFALERRQILTSTATPVSSTVLNGVLPGDSPVNPAVLPLAGTAPPSVPVTAQADPLTTPLRVPDPALQHELRAEQFAEQVGRRMLQQIREDRWTVHLQLDPQRLGPMEIELQLEGNQVTAQVGVANAEVRHLLESALPKLRESLDSAGLNLANWSFAQSGAREYREFAQQSAAAAAKAAPKGIEGAIEDEAPRRVTEDSASRVVDVYV
jgi:flagellar hook-length control protein FliK